MGCRVAGGGFDLWTNRNVPCVTRGRRKEYSFRTPPPLIKDRTPRGVWNALRTIDLRACMMAVQICALLNLNSGPPPSIKGRTTGGVRNPKWIVDLSAMLRTVQICACFITNSGPPPPPLKAERAGGSGIQYEPWICAPFSGPSRSARALPSISDPPPPSVKSRTLRGVRNQMWAVDIIIAIWAIGRCMTDRSGAENVIRRKNLG
jgi:hypothetical protein